MIKTNSSDFKRRLKILPSSMDIYITNACNMRCEYCASKYFIGNSGIKTLSYNQIIRAVDLFASYVDPKLCDKLGGDPAYIREVSFTGGEPLLKFNLVKRAVEYIRGNYPWMSIAIFTNGLLLDKKTADFFFKHDVKLIVSIDGPKRVNDIQRKAVGGFSAFDRIVSNLKKLGPGRRKKIHIMATFTQKTIGSLLEAFKFFKTLNCLDIHLGLELYSIWEKDKLKLLKSSIAEFKDYCVRNSLELVNLEKNWSFNFYFKDKVSASQDLTPSNSFTLSSKGVFYPCDELCVSNASEKIYGVGNLTDGIDFSKMEKIYSRAKTYIEKRGRINGVLSPIDRYFYCVLRDKDIGKRLKNSEAVTRIFLEEFDVFVEVERLCKKMAHNAEFGDFAHKPRYISNKEMKFLRLAINNGGNTDKLLAKTRELADYFLYSPGVDKHLKIDCLDNENNFDVAKAIILYSILKSKYLGKSIKIVFESGADNLKSVDLRFLKYHNALLGIKKI